MAFPSASVASVVIGHPDPGTPSYPDAGMQIATVVASVEHAAHTVAVIDSASRYAYFGTRNVPTRIVKVDLETFQVANTLVLSGLTPTPSGASAAVISPDDDFAYFVTLDLPAQVLKIDLENFSLDSVITLNAGESQIFSGVIDPDGDHAYFGTFEFPTGRIIQVQLRPTLERQDAVILQSGEDQVHGAVMHSSGNHAYFGAGLVQGRAVRVSLGDSFERVDSALFSADESAPSSAIIDPAGEFAYFGTSTSPGRIVKVRLTPTFERIDGIQLESGFDDVRPAAIDPDGRFGYFAARVGTAAHLVKVRLQPALSVVGDIAFYGADGTAASAVMDGSGRFAYFGTDNDPGELVKVATSQRGFIKASRVDLSEHAAPTALSFYAHEAAGHVRLALYGDGAAHPRLWQSEVVENTADGDWIHVPIVDGTPSSLTLEPGTYWLAWQIDTAAPVPGLIDSAPGDGLSVPFSWDAFPDELGEDAGFAISPTSEAWASTLTYAPIADLGLTKSVDDETPTVGDVVTYAIVLRNEGPATATGIQVSEPLPVGLTLDGYTATAGTYDPAPGVWHVPDLAANEEEILSLSALVTEPGTLVNTATVVSEAYDPNSENDIAQSSVEAAPDPCAHCDDGDPCTVNACDPADPSCSTNPVCDPETTCTADGAGITCGACPAGTYSDDGSGTSACLPCPDGQWAPTGATSCAPWQDCSADAYETMAPSAIQDRQCAPHTVCGDGEYEQSPPTATRDRQCESCLVCGPEEHEVEACTATADTVCAPREPENGNGADPGVEPDEPEVGCSCLASSSGQGAWPSLLGLLLGALLLRHRRR